MLDSRQPHKGRQSLSQKILHRYSTCLLARFLRRRPVLRPFSLDRQKVTESSEWGEERLFRAPRNSVDEPHRLRQRNEGWIPRRIIEPVIGTLVEFSGHLVATNSRAAGRGEVPQDLRGAPRFSKGPGDRSWTKEQDSDFTVCEFQSRCVAIARGEAGADAAPLRILGV